MKKKNYLFLGCLCSLVIIALALFFPNELNFPFDSSLTLKQTLSTSEAKTIAASFISQQWGGNSNIDHEKAWKINSITTDQSFQYASFLGLEKKYCDSHTQNFPIYRIAV